MFFLYILYSELIDRYYIGQTSNLKTRIRSHLTGNSFYTKQVRDWKLVYQEAHSSRVAAIAREKKLKSYKSKKYIKWLISCSTG